MTAIGTSNSQSIASGDTPPLQDLSYAEKLKARLDYSEDQYFRPWAYETKISPLQVKELREHRPHLWKDEDEEKTVQAPQQTGLVSRTIPAAIVRNKDLAAFLHEYFKDRISIAIDATRIGLWRKGIGVGEVVIGGKMIKPPPFPNKNKSGNRWVTQECIDWVEKWIVPQKSVARTGLSAGNGGEALPGTAMDFDRFKQEHAIWQMQREKDLSDGKFKSVEIFNQHLTRLGLAVNRALNEAEKGLKKMIAQEIKSAETPDQKPETRNPELISDAIERGVRAGVDALRTNMAKAIMEAEETTAGTTEEQ